MTETLAPGEGQDERREASYPARASSRRSARWRLVACVAIVVGALGWIAVRGLTGSFVYYLTPTDIAVHHEARIDQRVRLGGYVVPGSVRRPAGAVTFVVTDGETRLAVSSTGPVPQMFRAGQGVVVEGALGEDGRFHSDTLLIKHGGEYRAPTPAQTAGGG
jgi:cytochrome c-type biogenesis protein CcmE